MDWRFLMKRLTSIASVAWVLLAAITAPALASPPSPAVGVNLVNEPYKQTAPEQEATFRALQTAGVHVIRAGVPDNDQGLAFAQRASAYGIKVEWLLGVYPDPGTQWPRPPDAYKGKGLWRGWPLSTANADTFTTNIGAQLAKLESKGIVLAGFELGNEINWTGFNADFPLPAQGRVLNEKDLANDPEGRKIAQGYQRYLKTLAALKDIRDHSTLNRRTPIISAGLADLDDSGKWLRTVKADAVSVVATLHFLQANGLDRLVDGYGLHFYPMAANPGTAQGLAALRAQLQRNGLTECQPPGAAKGKPCWVTEWNFNGIKGLDACPIDDSSRIAMVHEMRSVLHELTGQRRLGGSLYYTWQGQIHAPKEDHDSAFLCGALTESGKLALSPM
jgi:hypothetical protein